MDRDTVQRSQKRKRKTNKVGRKTVQRRLINMNKSENNNAR